MVQGNLKRRGLELGYGWVVKRRHGIPDKIGQHHGGSESFLFAPFRYKSYEKALPPKTGLIR